MSKNAWFGVSLLVVLLLPFTLSGQQPGGLDPTFNGTGIRIDGFGNGIDQLNIAAIQQDGKIVVAGSASQGGGRPGLVARYNTDGSADITFNGNGALSLANDVGAVNALAILPDGEILATAAVYTGGQYTAFGLFRIHHDGTVDRTFGINGRVSTKIGFENDVPYSVGVQNDWKIVVAGSAGHPGHFSLPATVRYHSDGSLDQSFGQGGIVQTFFSSSSLFTSLTIQSDGKIVAVGSTGTSGIIIRYNADGSLDTSLGGGGIVTISGVRFSSVLVQSDGLIVAGGTSAFSATNFVVRLNANGTFDETFDGDGSASIFGIANLRSLSLGSNGKLTAFGTDNFTAGRLNSDGSLDTSFGNGGIVHLTLNPSDLHPAAAVLQVDGKLVAVGYLQPDYGRPDIIVVRFTINGDLDASFGDNGKVIADLGNSQSYTTAVATQADGKIVTVSRYIQPNTNESKQIMVARYNSDGSPDTTFGTRGLVSLGPGSTVDDYPTSLAIQPDGKIVIGGYYGYASHGCSVFRLKSNGTPDVTFSIGGRATVTMGTSSLCYSVALWAGKIILAGATASQSTGDFAMARFNENGSLDTTFGDNGKVITDMGAGYDRVQAVVVRPDGKIILAGGSDYEPGRVQIALAGFDQNGSLDPSFGSGGMVFTRIGVLSRAYSAGLQNNGQIVVAGYTSDTGSDLIVARYGHDGALDPEFGNAGIARTDLGGDDFARSIVIQPDQKIVAVGQITLQEDSYDYASIRYSPNGKIDTTWGTDGYVFTDLVPVAFDVASAASLDRSGKLIIAGDSNGLSGLVRYTAFTPLTQFDYDADGRSDISVFRPSTGDWYLQQSSTGFFGQNFGSAADRIVPADYDGDGKTDIAVYRPSTGIWYITNSASGTVTYHVFGIAEDLPTPADYDGDGKADISVFRSSTGTWYRINSSDGGFVAAQFGADGDRPTIGDFDGDGKADIAVYRPSTGAWYQTWSSNGFLFGEQFGISTDKITPADYDGDGKTDIAIYRPSEGLWYVKRSATTTYVPYVFGLAEDIPTPGDFDGDGKADIGVFRPSDGTWYIVNSSNSSYTIYQFGQNGDKPTQNAFND